MTREEAIEILDILPLCNECDSSNFPYTCAECGDAFLLAMEALKQPEVVRCKDCKHAVAQDCEQVWCSFVDDGLSHEPNWFCADGERKDAD